MTAARCCLRKIQNPDSYFVWKYTHSLPDGVLLEGWTYGTKAEAKATADRRLKEHLGLVAPRQRSAQP